MENPFYAIFTFSKQTIINLEKPTTLISSNLFSLYCFGKLIIVLYFPFRGMENVILYISRLSVSLTAPTENTVANYLFDVQVLSLSPLPGFCGCGPKEFCVNNVKILKVSSFYQYIVLLLEQKLHVTYQELCLFFCFFFSLVACLLTL